MRRALPRDAKTMAIISSLDHVPSRLASYAEVRLIALHIITSLQNGIFF
jgi:hypothetical protein